MMIGQLKDIAYKFEEMPTTVKKDTAGEAMEILNHYEKKLTGLLRIWRNRNQNNRGIYVSLSSK